MDSPFPPPVNPHDPGRRYLTLGVTWTLTSIAILAMTARLYLRGRVLHGISADDWLMLLAVLGQTGSQVCVTIASSWGLGMHDADLYFYPNLVNVLKWLWISLVPGTAGTVLARTSIAVFLFRLFGTKIWFKRFLIVTNVLQASTSIALLVIIFTSVRPVQGLWNPLLPAHRLDPHTQGTVALVAQSFLAFSDLTYVLFPVLIVWRLNMPLRQRVGLCLLLALSLGTLAASIAKAITSNILNTVSASGSSMSDLQYDAAYSNLIGNTEQSLVIIIGCIPPLRPIMKVKMVKSLSSSVGNLIARMRSGNSTKPATFPGYDSQPPYLKLGKMESNRRGGVPITSQSDQQLILQGPLTIEAPIVTVSLQNPTILASEGRVISRNPVS
ncbi:hypothetical protein GGS24DRAFT_511735 [Hypoxylon argillaceum]|nr:hypothetical protein GGS24DRAFT_511735 [Hypoxylon argillaceum]